MTRRRIFNERPAARYVHRMANADADAADHDAGLDTASDTAQNYLRSIADMCRPHLGQSVLEVGSGIGSITAQFADGRRIVATDLSAECVAALEARFRSTPNVEVMKADVRELDADGEFDSVLLINVLEHIDDDAGTLKSLRRFLAPNGTIVIYVPALNGLYGKWDRKVGHFRRYSRWRLQEVVAEAGLDLVELRYVNLLAIPAWFAFSRSNVDATAGRGLSLWDKTGVPLNRMIDTRVRMPLGLNLLCVARDPETAPG